ncbi:metallophosphoesterase [Candidatus Saccharibacteria bacterium]|nr:metallophosphoesterase [Candidatus Saccharibacteria bacterium]
MFLKEPLCCCTPKYTVIHTGVKAPVKVALTGDWHVTRIVSDKQRRFLKQKLQAIQPDLIILQGDLFDTPHSFDDLRLVAKLKKNLLACVKIAPTVMVIGNHDQVEPIMTPPKSRIDYLKHARKNVLDEWRRICKECGVKLLIDEWFEIKGLRIFGMWQGPEAYFAGPGKRGESIEEMRRHIKELGQEGVLKFRPKKAHWFAAHAPINELSNMKELAGFNVFSFGHTHGGCVPIVVDAVVDACGGHGGIVAPFQKWFPKHFMRGQETLPNGASFIVNAGMVMAQGSAPKPLHYINFIKAAEITEVILRD